VFRFGRFHALACTPDSLNFRLVQPFVLSL
jgi:hypothetical protein